MLQPGGSRLSIKYGRQAAVGSRLVMEKKISVIVVVGSVHQCIAGSLVLTEALCG